MPFQSKAQRRKFYALKSRGEMDQKTIDEWESDTPKKLPERVKKVAFYVLVREALGRMEKRAGIQMGLPVVNDHTDDLTNQIPGNPAMDARLDNPNLSSASRRLLAMRNKRKDQALNAATRMKAEEDRLPQVAAVPSADIAPYAFGSDL